MTDAKSYDEKMVYIKEYAETQAALCGENDAISPLLYKEYGVKRGLRDENGDGVLTGLTNISKIVSFKRENGEKVPCEGELWYRGYNIRS
ncbi:MAG: citrate synthase, partial [Clostridia bacterium]|nr:citrate synthase [Clostridia bacterium]